MAADRIHRAQRPHRCHDGSHPHMIQAGELYRSVTIYPGDDDGAATPYRRRQCVDCATRHGRELAGERLATVDRGEATC